MRTIAGYHEPEMKSQSVLKDEINFDNENGYASSILRSPKKFVSREKLFSLRKTERLSGHE